MPKGALLHGHLDAMCSPHFLLATALAQPTLVVSSSMRVTAENLALKKPKLSFTYLPLSDVVHTVAAEGDDSNLTSKHYEPGDCVSAALARKLFPGGPEAFDAYALQQLVLPDPDLGMVQHFRRH